LFVCMLRGLGQLRRLDLSNNNVSVLPDGALRHCPRLQRVILDHNRLTTLRQCSLATGQAELLPFRTLSLVGNPLYCDCRLAWLVSAGDGRPTTAVWWAACRGGTGDNRTDVVRHHSYFGLTPPRAGACIASPPDDDCPFNP